jgi:uncharacterized membrane protein
VSLFDFGGLRSVIWSTTLLMLLGSILFSVRKKWSDIISFFIFLLSAIYLVHLYLTICNDYPMFDSNICFDFTLGQLAMSKLEIAWIILSTIALFILTVEFYKNRVFKNYK